MYNIPPNRYPCPYYNTPVYNKYTNQIHPCPYYSNNPMYDSNFWNQFPNEYLPYKEQVEYDTPIIFEDYGPYPYVVNIDEATKQNNNFRTALWTGRYLQLTLMSINIGEDIGLEIHPNLDQFIRIEEGQGLVQMGDSKDRMNFQSNVYDDSAFIIPAGKWHNLINTGNIPLKLYSIYAPPQHPYGTIHESKQDAEEHHNH